MLGRILDKYSIAQYWYCTLVLRWGKKDYWGEFIMYILISTGMCERIDALLTCGNINMWSTIT